MLRCRIAAAKDHIELNRDFDGYAWKDLPGAMPSWVANFTHRVTDVSSLGNVVSTQNRYVQLNYVTKEKQLRKGLAIQPPSGVTARGTPRGGRRLEERAARREGFLRLSRRGEADGRALAAERPSRMRTPSTARSATR